jgi:hypothetical protein
VAISKPCSEPKYGFVLQACNVYGGGPFLLDATTITQNENNLSVHKHIESKLR